MTRAQDSRNHLFDLLRIVFAAMVLISHAFEFTDGNRGRELFGRLTGSTVSFGEVGVDGFFLLSGYLIFRSWDRDPETLNFLRKRILRIVPGYLVAALASTRVVGLIAPGVPHFFSSLRGVFLVSLTLLSFPYTPTVFPGMFVHSVNGSLWTISYEFRCYLLVALAGMSGLLRRRALWLVVTLILFCAMTYVGLGQSSETSLWVLLFGSFYENCRLTAAFLVGGCFYSFRRDIRFVPWIACLAVIVLLGIDLMRPSALESALIVCGSYFLFWRTNAPNHWLAWMRRVPDVSYGVYLYGWPVLGVVIWYLHWSPWLVFLLSTLICLGLGWLSWHFIERPMLTLKRRATAPLPPA